MAAVPGFEPRQTESESAVLPLHNTAIFILHANDAIKKENKAGDISDDEAKNSEDEIQKITDKYIAMIDSAIDDKTKEILTV